MRQILNYIFLIQLFWSTHGVCQSTYYFNDSIKARKDIVDVVIGAKRDSLFAKKDNKNKKMYFSLMPVSSSGSDVSFSAISTSFYLGDPQNTHLSNVTFYPTTNFTSYIHFKAFPNIWLSENSWNIPGKLQIAQEKINSYGLGANTAIDNEANISYKLSRAYITINKSIFRYFLIGIGYNLDYFYDVEAAFPTQNNYPLIPEQTTSSGITFNLLRDNRKNSINPIGGFYTNLSIRMNDSFTGSDNTWQSVYLDARKYINFSTTRHNTLAFWGMYWGTWGDTPYLNLPGTGLDYSNWTGRGTPKARYIGEHMLYSEIEYRFDITPSGLLGAVAFANFQSFTEPDSQNFENLIPAAGTGLRLKFNKFSDSNITLDFAVGKESYHWYFSLNEVF